MTNTSAFDPFVSRLRDLIRSSKAVPRSAGDTEFNRLALDLFALQFEHNPLYKEFCAGRSVKPERIEHWTQIPAVPSTAFKDWELTSLPAHDRSTVFHSSGTSQQRPSRHFHNALSLSIYEESLWSWFAPHLLAGSPTAGLDLLILSPPLKEAPHSSLVHMFEHVRQKLRATPNCFFANNFETGWKLRPEEFVSAASEATWPVLILGTAFSFVHLLDWLAEKNGYIDLPEGSRVMETGGYKGQSREVSKPELHALIAERLGISQQQIVTEYGMSELSSQGYDRLVGAKDAPGFLFPPWARVAIISPETGHQVNEGETGLLRIYDLANVFSVMAIQTEDLAVCKGAGFELLGRAELSEARGCSLLNVESRES